MANIPNLSQEMVTNYSCGKQLHSDNLQRESKFIKLIYSTLYVKVLIEKLRFKETADAFSQIELHSKE